MKWQYGDSWEKYPINEGEIWTHVATGSKITVHDLRTPLPEFMQNVDLFYCDPPWSKGNTNSFITKAGMNTYISDFEVFLNNLFNQIKALSSKVCYVEMGLQNLNETVQRMHILYQHVAIWQITYYQNHLCFLIRGGCMPPTVNLTGLDDTKTPLAAIKAENPLSVADLCTGRGLTLLAAHKHGAQFFGTELNRRRLAVAIDRAAKQGVHYEKHPIQ